MTPEELKAIEARDYNEQHDTDSVIEAQTVATEATMSGPEYGPDRVKVVVDAIRWGPTHPDYATKLLRDNVRHLTRDDLLAALVVLIHDGAAARRVRATA